MALTGGERDDAIGEVSVVPLTAEHAAAASSWRYEAPWSVYDGSDVDPISSAKGYSAIVAGSPARFLGFVCLGADARVPGLGEEEGTIDVGVGLEPELVGRGLGPSIVGPVLDWAVETTGTARLRATVQAWNARSIGLCERLGFEAVGRHRVEGDGEPVDYILFHRDG